MTLSGPLEVSAWFTVSAVQGSLVSYRDLGK